MNAERISNCYRRVTTRVKSCFNPTTLEPQKMRGVLLGTIITALIGEICAYKLIKQNVMAGELNIYTTDFIIMGMALLEAILGPLVAWYGYRNRRMVMIAWNIALIVVSLTWLAMPAMSQRVESEYCHGLNFVFRGITVTPKAAVRVSLVVGASVVFVLSRAAVLSHGIAYIDENAPARIGMHFGIIVIVRVIPLLAGDRILTAALEGSLNIQVLGLVGGTVGTLVQIFLFMPKYLPSPGEGDESSNFMLKRGFLSSVSRVLQSTYAMSEMVAIGLLAAALWGFAYNEDEIVKVTYHIDTRNSSVANIAQILRYYIVIISVLYVGVKFSAPILAEFCRYRGIKQATVMSVIALIFYILLMTVSTCNRGYVAGLEGQHYVSPNCSLPCNCIPRWNEFDPVCVVDQITTYVSPCQAGCRSSETLDNIRVYTNCICAPNNGNATMGACSLENCFQAYQLHLSFFIMLIMVTVLAFQAHGLIILREVDPRDKSVALGIMGSVVAMIAFVCGHLIFLGVNAATCRWYEGARCHLQSQKFPIYIGSTSGAMVLLSIIISITNWVCWKVAERRKAKDNDLDSPEERVLMDDR